LDGTGYPAGLKDEQIPVVRDASFAVADVYDALSSRRVYKEAFSHEVAKGIILKESGSHFDPADRCRVRGGPNARFRGHPATGSARPSGPPPDHPPLSSAHLKLLLHVQASAKQTDVVKAVAMGCIWRIANVAVLAIDFSIGVEPLFTEHLTLNPCHQLSCISMPSATAVTKSFYWCPAGSIRLVAA